MNLKPAVALRLAQHPNIMGIKEASGDLKQVMDILHGRADGFTVLSGDDWLTLPLITSGGDGLISVVSNEVPAAMTALVHLLLAGNLEPARVWHYRTAAAHGCQFPGNQTLLRSSSAAPHGPDPERAAAAVAAGELGDLHGTSYRAPAGRGSGV